MSGVFHLFSDLSLHSGRGWEREVKCCSRINKREIVSKSGFCAVRVWFPQGVLCTIVKPQNVFKTKESKNSDKSERNRIPG